MAKSEETDTDVSDPAADAALWAAVLKSLLSDGLLFSRGRADKDGEREAAFYDLMTAGPMLCWCCRFLRANPQWISEQFAKRINRWH